VIISIVHIDFMHGVHKLYILECVCICVYTLYPDGMHITVL